MNVGRRMTRASGCGPDDSLNRAAQIMRSIVRPLAWIAAVSLSSSGSACSRAPRTAADNTETDRASAIEELNDARAVLREISSDGEIPLTQRERAQCVVVVPSLVSGGLILGARHGHGVVTCRTSGRWSGPAFVALSGGSAGLQVGLESADLVMLVMSERGMAQLFRSSFQFGADVSVAAGPTGQSVQAGTDVKMRAEIFSYARTRGLFAGVEVSGAVMRQDQAANAALFGTGVDVHAILTAAVPPPAEAAAFLEQVESTFPRYADAPVSFLSGAR